MKTAIQTRDAPEAIGTYSQAVRADHTVYLSGQIGLDPATMQLAEGIDGQSHRVVRNLAAGAARKGGARRGEGRASRGRLPAAPPADRARRRRGAALFQFLRQPAEAVPARG